MASAFDFLPIIAASQQADAARQQAEAANRQAEADRAAAARQEQLQNEQFDYFKQQNEKDRAALQPIIDSYLRTSATNEANAAKDRARYENVAIPLQDQIIADANSYASPERKQLEMGQAMALVSGQMEGQRNSAIRNLESFGIDPSAARYAGLDANYRALSGATQAAAGTKAGQNVDAVARELRGQAANMLAGLPAQSLQNTGAVLNAGNAASGATLGLTNSAASTTGTAPQYGALSTQNMSNATGAINAGTGAINAGTSAINSLNQGYGNYYNNQNANSGSGWGSLLGLAAGTLAGGQFGGSMGSALGGWLTGRSATGGSSGYGGMRYPIANNSGGFDWGGWGNGVNYAEGGHVPDEASPTQGMAIDDVPARLTAGEFVIPKDTLQWKGEEFFQKVIDQSRKAKDQAVAKPEVGVAPQQPPTFVSRPQKFAQGGAALPMRLPYGQRYNPETDRLDANDAKGIGFRGPVSNGDHIVSEYSSDRDIQYPSVYNGISDADLASVLMAERLHRPAPREVDDRAYTAARDRVSRGQSPFYDGRVDPYPAWSPDQHWEEAAIRTPRAAIPVR